MQQYVWNISGGICHAIYFTYLFIFMLLLKCTVKIHVRISPENTQSTMSRHPDKVARKIHSVCYLSVFVFLWVLLTHGWMSQEYIFFVIFYCWVLLPWVQSARCIYSIAPQNEINSINLIKEPVIITRSVLITYIERIICSCLRIDRRSV